MNFIGFDNASHIDGGSAFSATNESVETNRELALEAAPKRAGAVASGGEVPLQILLPICPEGVVAIDHSIGSIRWAILKAAIIDAWTPDEVHKHLGKNIAGSTLRELTKLIPVGTVRASLDTYTVYSSGMNPFSTYWNTCTVEDIGRIKANLDKLTFVLGDLETLEKYGPFDLVYTSNAMEYTRRRQSHKDSVYTSPHLDNITKALKLGGFVLFTGQANPHTARLSRSKSGSNGSWTHHLYQHNSFSLRAKGIEPPWRYTPKVRLVKVRNYHSDPYYWDITHPRTNARALELAKESRHRFNYTLQMKRRRNRCQVHTTAPLNPPLRNSAETSASSSMSLEGSSVSSTR